MAFKVAARTVLELGAELISPDAVAVARQNIERLGLSDRVSVEQVDLFDPVSRLPDPRPFDLILANPPYIPTGAIEKLERNVREYEPVGALDGGIDGLIVHRRIAEGAAARLRGAGRLFLEIQFDQSQAVTEILGGHDAFEGVRTLKDHAGHLRVVTATRK